MAAGFKKILITGDAAELSDEDPHAIGTTAAAGVATDASRHDHVHIIGTGAINASAMFAASVVDNAAMADDAIKAAEIDATATDIELSQIILTPKATATGTTEGTIFYDSDDDHLYVYTGT